MSAQTTTSALSAAVALALALGAGAARAADTPQAAKDVMAKGMTEHCYGINAAGKNDCAAGAHSCAGQSTAARDPKSFVLLPAGACSKIQGGSTQPM